MLRIRYVLLALFLSFSGLASLAQAEDIVPSRRYNTADGLPNNSITALAQTQNGLLWIGTRHGLVAYDGHEFRGIELPDSVRGMTVTTLREASDGSVWAGIEDDVVKVTPRGVTRSYLLDSHNVVEILKRGQRVLFVTHTAVWEQAPKSDSLSRTRFRYEALDDVTQGWAADWGPEGQLWIVNGREGPGRVGVGGVVDFADPTIGTLVDAVDISRRPFARRVRNEPGATPAALLRRRRIERAKRQLEEDPETIAGVATAVGFRSPSHFSQVFQKEVGCTPTMCVKSHLSP